MTFFGSEIVSLPGEHGESANSGTIEPTGPAELRAENISREVPSVAQWLKLLEREYGTEKATCHRVSIRGVLYQIECPTGFWGSFMGNCGQLSAEQSPFNRRENPSAPREDPVSSEQQTASPGLVGPPLPVFV